MGETFALSIGDMKMSMGPALPKLAVPPPSTLAWDGTAFLNIVKSHPVNDGLFVSLSTQSADLVPLKLANWVSKTTFQGKFNIGYDRGTVPSLVIHEQPTYTGKGL